jgi:hypothetical protein
MPAQKAMTRAELEGRFEYDVVGSRDWVAGQIMDQMLTDFVHFLDGGERHFMAEMFRRIEESRRKEGAGQPEAGAGT